jgi:nitroimidazol reductase NimA-like FMN-containing flavoprotein (pyridoxamine 5'-phosphate oxidase superfamily)
MTDFHTEPSNESPYSGTHRAGDAARAQSSGQLNVTVRELSRDESVAILARHHLGRVGITFHDHLRLKLCNYLYSEHWIYARAELGDDLVMAEHHPWAAFEVDEIDGILDWRSVEVRGAIEFLSSDLHSPDWFEFENAVRLLRSAVPEVLRADDPMPQSIRLVRIHVDEIAGRESRVGNPRPLPQP